MCVYSVIHEHFDPRIPREDMWPRPFTLPVVPPDSKKEWSTVAFATKKDIDDLRATIERLTKVIEDFRTAGAAAKKIDEITGQPDCLDPGKAGLEERVAKLEKRLEEITTALRDAST